MRTLPILLAAAALAGLSCEEPFPAYSDPENVLRGAVTIDVADTVRVRFDPTTERYYFNNLMVFHVSVTNEYDGLLEGTALVSGAITVHSFAQTPRTYLIPLTPASMRQPPLFQGNLALPPGVSAEFLLLWLPVSTDGSYPFQGLPYRIVGDSRLYGPVEMSGWVDLQLFERVQPMRFGDFTLSPVFRVDGEISDSSP